MEAAKNFVFQITKRDSDLLESLLREKSNWEFAPLEYGYYKAKQLHSREKVTIASYTSGKLVIQGSGAAEVVEFILEPCILKERAFTAAVETKKKSSSSLPGEETPLFTAPHAGIDESGKGDFFGPLVVAAAFVEDEETAGKLLEAGAKDSKKIKNDAAMTALAGKIRAILKGKYAIVALGPEAYNRVYTGIGNLNRLLAWGHAKSVEALREKAPECKRALSDKFADERYLNTAFAKLKIEDFQLDQEVRAESDIAVAAASILARAEFVRRMKLLEEACGMSLPKGAGTAVDTAAEKLFLAGGEELLRKNAKMHFRNAYKAMGLPMPEKPAYDFHKNK